MNRMQYCSECCLRGVNSRRRDGMQAWACEIHEFKYLTKLLYHVRRQAVRPSLAFSENMQVIARSWAANTPVHGAQHSKLGKLELRGADVEQRSKLPRVGNRAVDHVLEALNK
jgi:hypothetical protein